MVEDIGVFIVKGVAHEQSVPRKSVLVGNFVEHLVGKVEVSGFRVESDEF